MSQGKIKKMLGALILLIMLAKLFAAAIWFPTNQNQESQVKITTNSQQSKANGDETLWHWMTHDAITVYTFMLVLFNAILAVATVKLWQSTVMLVEGAEGTAERQLRAYVLVEKAQVLDIKIGKIPRAKITVVNSGQTPAKNFKQWSLMGFDHFPAKLPAPTTVEKPFARHPLAPKGIIYAYPSLGHPLVADQVDGLTDGRYAIFVVGRIDYEDAFGNPCWTTYKLFVGGPIGIESGAMSAYYDGNDYT